MFENEECAQCNLEVKEDFELENWYKEELCEACNKELPKVCNNCDHEIEDDETYCSAYCHAESNA